MPSLIRTAICVRKAARESDQGRHILIAVARYLAAHFSTQRALLQTADIATRLMGGGELHREARSLE
jgi:hemerythrin